MKVIVTGSSGFIAGKVIPFLTSKGHDVLGVDLKAGPLTDHIIEILSDVGKLDSTYQPDLIINLAAQTDTTQQSNFIDANFYQVVSLRKCFPDVYFVQASTMLADTEYYQYSDINSIRYGASKLITEQYFRSDPLFLSVRFPMVYSQEGMNHYHLKKYKKYCTVFKFLKSDVFMVKKSMLDASMIAPKILSMVEQRRSGMVYLCDEFLTSTDDLAFAIARKKPSIFRFKIPVFLINALLPLLGEGYRRQLHNASTEYDFR